MEEVRKEVENLRVKYDKQVNWVTSITAEKDLKVARLQAMRKYKKELDTEIEMAKSQVDPVLAGSDVDSEDKKSKSKKRHV